MLLIVAASRRTGVYLEVGPRRTFACAVEWPGWARSAPGEQAALEALANYAPRYARMVARTGITFPRIRVGDLDVVERVPGSAVTDFGAPGAIPVSDRRPLVGAPAGRLVALLGAAWEEFDDVVAAAPPSLRKGPRGGGRDRDGIVEHVIEAERSYARHIGIRQTAHEWRDGGVALMRERILEVVGRRSDGAPMVEPGWPPRYFARRTAWHALDHAWEIEDRST
jgi:hypothetical protein